MTVRGEQVLTDNVSYDKTDSYRGKERKLEWLLDPKWIENKGVWENVTSGKE